MGRFRHRSLNVEVKHRFRAAGALLRQAPPARIASASGAIAHHALADEIDIGVVVVGRPMALEIVEEGGPVGLEAMRLEIAKWKRKAMIDAD